MSDTNDEILKKVNALHETVVKKHGKIFIRKTVPELIMKPGMWNATGCNSYIMYNAGNINVTVFKNIVLRPGQFISGPNEDPYIKDHSETDVIFDVINTPTIVAPETGPAPSLKEVVPGDPPPAVDRRLAILKSYLEEEKKD